MSPPPVIDRKKQFHLLLSEAEHANLKEMADAYDMTLSDYIRWSLRWHWTYKHKGVVSKSQEHKLMMGAAMKAELAQWDAENVSAAALADVRRGSK